MPLLCTGPRRAQSPPWAITPRRSRTCGALETPLLLLGALAFVSGGVALVGSPSPVRADSAADAEPLLPPRRYRAGALLRGRERDHLPRRNGDVLRPGRPVHGPRGPVPRQRRRHGHRSRHGPRVAADATRGDLRLEGGARLLRIPGSRRTHRLARPHREGALVPPELLDRLAVPGHRVLPAGRPGVGKDQQYWTSNEYLVGTTHGGAHTAFGVNHATGHIKGYPAARVPRASASAPCAARGYGVNDFVDNGDGTITDKATGLTWMKADSGPLKAGPNQDGRLDWPQALSFAEGLEYAGHDDWRLPNVKELQSIVDYSGAFPAIDSTFQCSSILNEAKERGLRLLLDEHVRLLRAQSAPPYLCLVRGLRACRRSRGTGHARRGRRSLRHEGRGRSRRRGRGADLQLRPVRARRPGHSQGEGAGAR